MFADNALKSLILVAVLSLITAACNGETAETARQPEDEPGVVMGEPDAPVTMIEYASLTCGACGAFHNQVLPTLKEEYIEPGQVRLVFREMLTPPPQLAAQASTLARCGEDEYFEVAAAIFRGQRQMFTASNPLAALRRIAASVGFDAQEFNACVTDETYRSQVEAAMQAANEDEVNSTPTFIINGERFVGLRNTEQMRAILDRKLAEAQNRGSGDGEDDTADTGDGTQ